MVSDAYADGNDEASFNENMEEEPNVEAKRFYDILDAAKHPIYDGCKEGLSKCVDLSGGKLTGMKSHDCHVLMQRLIPIAFAELLDKSVHKVLSDCRNIKTRSYIWTWITPKICAFRVFDGFSTR